MSIQDEMAYQDELRELRAKIERLRSVIADNCDPGDATPEDRKTILECIWWKYPERKP